MLIAQLSDIHARRAGASLEALARALRWLAGVSPDALVVSGDVADEPEGFGLVRQLLRQAHYPVFLIPGNVDDTADMRAEFADNDYWEDGPRLNFARDLGALRVIGLDVTVPGESFGDAGPVADWLRRQLPGGPPALVFTHQNAFRTGTDRLDRNMCRNADLLVGAIEASPGAVLAICCGHGHRAIFARLGSVPAMMCPSITGANALQFDGRAPADKTDPPGLMLHQLTAGGLVSHVVSLGA